MAKTTLMNKKRIGRKRDTKEEKKGKLFRLRKGRGEKKNRASLRRVLFLCQGPLKGRLMKTSALPQGGNSWGQGGKAVPA